MDSDSQIRVHPRVRSSWRAGHIVERRRIAAVTRRTTPSRVVRMAGLAVGGLLAFVAATVGTGVLVASGVVAALSADLPDPSQLDGLSFHEPTVLYDRTCKGLLAPFQQEQWTV